MKKSLLALAALSAVIAGCAYPSPGAAPSDTPPQIVIRNDVRTWDHPGAFGPVPESLLERGQSVCGALDTDKVKYQARGYHPSALNLEGKAFPGGGYYCVPRG